MTTRTLAAVPARGLIIRTLKSLSFRAAMAGYFSTRALRRAASRALTGPSPSATVWKYSWPMHSLTMASAVGRLLLAWRMVQR